LRGQPTADILVSFIPTGSTKGNGVSAVTDESGEYELTHPATGNAGVSPGTYIVLFKSRGSEGDASDVSTRRDRIGSEDPIPPAWRVPSLAGRHNTVTVPDGGKTFDFDIVGDPSSSPRGEGPRPGGRR
jgi:hypothetical protein